LMPRPEDHEGYVATHAIRGKRMLPIAIKSTAMLLRIAGRQRTRIRQLREQLGEVPPAPEPPRADLRARARWALWSTRDRFNHR
ncbi:MAG: hypothetical protein ACRDOJ_14190, partial [Nocardioidaceae bacterium]